MYRETISAEFVVKFLNDLIEIDRDSVMSLIETRVRCKGELANHESIQTTFESGRDLLGVLGLLNGFFGTSSKNGYGCIVAHYDGDENDLGNLTHFSVKRDW